MRHFVALTPRRFGARLEWSGEIGSPYEVKQMKVTIHKEPKPKTWIGIEHNLSDDVMQVICHWHHKPSLSEVNEMRKMAKSGQVHGECVFFVVKTTKGDSHKGA